MSYTRFAIYYMPPEGPLADFGASWLGWDAAHGRPGDQPDLPGLDDVTMTPRKYGFHATLKPPFRLAAGRDAAALDRAVAALAAECAPASASGLRLSRLGRFLALTPEGDAAGIDRVAAACVRGLDGFRAPASEAELARRRAARLSDRQEALLARWGYPYVMEEFRFHMTLTGRLPQAEIARWVALLEARLPALPAPFVLDQVALMGERADGRFELIQRYALSG
ncbi:MAG TPA: phosphonate metabolism protein [Rhodobacteraceae bacterium]|nr:phosphonate metabolism protein [Paracoccaceae bacterium]